MSLLNSVLKVFIPNKSKKDLREAEPIVKKIHEKGFDLEKNLMLAKNYRSVVVD